ncbi:MAG: hypothetical protein Q4P33_06785 [Flaviflexus sp.]|nr:hypothetical protein [Flaviflexus sp.]
MDYLLGLTSCAFAIILALLWYRAMFVNDDVESLDRTPWHIRAVRQENFYALSCPSGTALFGGGGILLLIQAFTAEKPSRLLGHLPMPVTLVLAAVALLCSLLFVAGLFWPFRLPSAINPAARARARAATHGVDETDTAWQKDAASGHPAAQVPPPELPSPFPAFAIWLVIAIVLYFSRHLYPPGGTVLASAHLFLLAIITLRAIITAQRRSSTIPAAKDLIDPRHREAYAKLDDTLRGRQVAFTFVTFLYLLGFLLLVVFPLAGYEVLEAVIGGLTSAPSSPPRLQLIAHQGGWLPNGLPA